ncbi:MAG: DUF1266 domain-containing protein [Odoribacter sp.]|nr:DUF1266 domain-containing protein [Odoribacter sp.]
MMGNSLFPEMLEVMQQNAQAQMNKMANLQSNIQSILSGEPNKETEEFIAQHPQPEDLKKYLALGSIFVNMRAEPVQTLELMDDKDYYKEECLKGWGISGNVSTAETIENLLAGGHYARLNDVFLRLKAGNYEGIDDEDLESYQETCSSLKDYLDYTLKDIQNCPSIKAWDLERAAYLARVTCNIDYITKEEAWTYLQRIGEETKKIFYLLERLCYFYRNGKSRFARI